MCTPQGIIEKVGCLAVDEAVKAAIKAGKYVKDYTTNLEKLQAEKGKLEGRREIIEDQVRGASNRGDEVYKAVLDWQKNADTMTCDVVQLLKQTETDRMTGDVQEQLVGRTEADGVTRDVQEQRLVGQSSGTGNVSCFKCSCPNIKRRYQLSKQAEEKIVGVQKLILESNFKENEISHPRPPPPELEYPSNENYFTLDSRTPVFERIVDALKDPSVNVIGVHGLGGVGKTTLVKEVGKKMQHDGTFKQVPIAVVSKDLNVKEIQSKLADRLDIKLVATSDEKGRARKLWNKFINGEKYLVILDDIWEEVDIRTIGIPLLNGSTTGCKVLLTSRNEDLLARMKVNRSFSIAELPMPEAWTLFNKLTGNSIDESRPEIYSLAYEVCKKCKGLPVAINAVGAALNGKPEHAWKNALDNLERYMITNIEGINPSVWASLKLSYDMLWSSDAKSCFLLCCLFPKDVETSIDDLARHCLTRCLLSQNPRTLEEARDAVRTLVGSLKSASLLSNDNDENVVRIHDVIRDVGISIARKEEAFLIDHGAVRWPRNPINGPRYLAISLRAEKIKGLPNELTCPQLHTLMFVNSKFSHLEVPDNFFSGMKQLTVLILCRMSLRKLPSSLAKLASLGMLCLEHCQLEDIAILGDLKTTLEVLSLRGSTIKALPQEIEKLTNLLLLDLRECTKLEVIPRGVISNLTSLEELYLPYTFDGWEATEHKRQDTSISNVTLEELRWSLNTGQLTTLQMHVPDVMLLPKEGLNFEKLKIFRILVRSSSKKRPLFYYWKLRSYEKLLGTRVLIYEGSSLRNEFIPLVDKADSLYLRDIKDLKKVLHDRGIGNRFFDLKYIKVISCDDYLEYLIEEPKSFDQSHGLHPSKSFSNLIEVIISKCKLKYLFSPSSARKLVHLKKLEVKSCDIIEGIVGFEEQNDEDEIRSAVKFSLLNQLLLRDLPNLIGFYVKKEKAQTTMENSSVRAQPLFNEKVIFPVLERLTICRVGNIIEIWDNNSIAVWQEQGSFCQLMEMNVDECDKLMHVYLCSMHPLFKNLERLDVHHCGIMKGVVRFEGQLGEDGLRNDQICFNKLINLRLSNLPSFVSFCIESGTVGRTNDDATIHGQSIFNEKVILPVLEGLIISKMGNVIQIWDKQSIEDKGSFCQLTDVSVGHCDRLLLVFPSKMHPLLTNLKKLNVEGCAAMEGIVGLEGETDEDGLRNEVCFNKLSRLELGSLPNLVSFCTKLGTASTTDGNATIHAQPLFNEKIRSLGSLLRMSSRFRWSAMSLRKCSGHFETFRYSDFAPKVAFPVLKSLDFRYLDKITKIWDDQPLSESENEAISFCELTSIGVVCCEDLEYVLPFYMLPHELKNLQRLMIYGCAKMEVIISNNPKEKVATNNDTILFPQLKTLDLEDLPNLKSLCSETQLFFSSKVSFPVLNFLKFSHLPMLTRIWDNQPLSEQEREAKSFCKLQYIICVSCVHLEYVLPFYMLPQLKNLRELNIRDCMKMEVIISNNPMEKEATNNDTIWFPQLKSMELENLPNLKTLCTETRLFLSNKDAFPVLEKILLRPEGTLEFLRDETSTKEVSMKECGTSGKEIEVLEKECGTSGKEG
ncbi:hypothetical protein RHMOL_Rhmol07G0236500 [Rhododendron molle]|uniref:Uncharacterized protein n=1 Tax=Rhododendron molle TaxID=49168 RepID=A0ACC0N3Y3_RHOML|nr:hypothetical protein RHMOL_Rhmol07G0236500 [Rhododendron molle]